MDETQNITEPTPLGRVDPELARQWVRWLNEVLRIGHGQVTVVVMSGKCFLQPQPSIGPFEQVVEPDATE